MDHEEIDDEGVIIPEEQTVYGNNFILRQLTCSPNSACFTFSCNDEDMDINAEDAFNLLKLCQASPEFYLTSNFLDERTVTDSYMPGLTRLLNGRFWNNCRSVSLNGPFTDNILMTLPATLHPQTQGIELRNITTTALKLSNIIKRHLMNLTSLNIDARRMQLDNMESIIYQIVATKITKLNHIWMFVNNFTADLDTVIHLLSAVTVSDAEIYIVSEQRLDRTTEMLLVSYGFVKQNEVEYYPAPGSHENQEYETWTYETAVRRFVFAFLQHCQL